MKGENKLVVSGIEERRRKKESIDLSKAEEIVFSGDSLKKKTGREGKNIAESFPEDQLGGGGGGGR